ncbi:MAG: hypothetical protein KKD75_06025, partial [Nanoarchaeota archaeon]|nr:hypothetical protein [Nanoarchaeota archaeon]MBU1632444.1 hypothetical protein [Nanoarchaeota archaeon]
NMTTSSSILTAVEFFPVSEKPPIVHISIDMLKKDCFMFYKGLEGVVLIEYQNRYLKIKIFL